MNRLAVVLMTTAKPKETDATRGMGGSGLWVYRAEEMAEEIRFQKTKRPVVTYPDRPLILLVSGKFSAVRSLESE